MAMNEKMQTAVNDQINAEMYSAYLYLQMSAWLDAQNLRGMATWMGAQAREEMAHAMKFFKFVQARGGAVTLKPVEGPPAAWKSPLAAFEAALAHEQYITGRINHLMDLAIDEHDHASRSLLQWFVDEQVEEEDNATVNVENIKRVQNHPQGLFMLDRQMGARGASE
jgi:ferritin